MPNKLQAASGIPTLFVLSLCACGDPDRPQPSPTPEAPDAGHCQEDTGTADAAGGPQVDGGSAPDAGIQGDSGASTGGEGSIACRRAQIRFENRLGPNEVLKAIPGFLFAAYAAEDQRLVSCNPRQLSYEAQIDPTGPFYGESMACNRAEQTGGKYIGWQPHSIVAHVSDATGTPLSGCLVEWSADNGHVFRNPDNLRSDGDGNVAVWIRGNEVGTTRITARLSGAARAELEATVLPGIHTNLMPAVYGAVPSPPLDAYRVVVIPKAKVDDTYYAVINAQGFYTGIQSPRAAGMGRFLFSSWGTHDCQHWPQVISDTAEVCVPPREGQAEGCHNQCTDDLDWQVDGRYEFVLTATPRTRPSLDRTTMVEAQIPGVDLHLIVRDPASGQSYFDIQVWRPEPTVLRNPSSFIEMWGGDTLSCLRNPKRRIVFSDPQYIATGSTDFVPAPLFEVSRPFDTSYGRGSMCFTHDFGRTEEGFFTGNGGAEAAPFLLAEGILGAGRRTFVDRQGRVMQGTLRYIDAQPVVMHKALIDRLKPQFSHNPRAFAGNVCGNLAAVSGPLDACKEQCLRTRDCNAFNFSDTERLCFLRTCADGDQALDDNPSYDSYRISTDIILQEAGPVR